MRNKNLVTKRFSSGQPHFPKQTIPILAHPFVTVLPQLYFTIPNSIKPRCPSWMHDKILKQEKSSCKLKQTLSFQSG